MPDCSTAPRKPGRKPIFDVAMSEAERSASYRLRRAARVDAYRAALESIVKAKTLESAQRAARLALEEG